MARLTKEERKVSIMTKALELFSKEGFYQTTMPSIAEKIGMSVGNLYNYFTSKEMLAKDLILYIANILGEEIRKINESPLNTKEKIDAIVHMYFRIAQERPETIEYFLRVYLSNREVFQNCCEGMICVSAFVTELMIFFEEGVRSGDLRDQDFFSAFGLFMGYLGGMVFINGEKILPKPLESYESSISENIYYALKTR
ncbi:MAG: TetR/AcrR family transcriptional regulator [Sulfuricurvum sp.]|uniref:TetR/AcrR family transcriptional regulator n=1 Tax=Sulfuricurvum sp. TaxID=2025608 RepID=UPI00260DCA06|nr:TetR/AcrR family transcriptional regulator [Sulfuricurvum sp.]MDD2369369.1 TetR/AcrR family transcriptional regulator [Sulfuricurvum sp.]MDD2949599.1 TetR/AcrR family transcriptional regulator [Sulfuricurvum sp.]MDD5117021.1 TetR/AcrR family transcriptional regulator [Sulfuricurvum sp.]